MKSLRYSLITAAVALLSIGQLGLVSFVKSSNYEVANNTPEEKSKEPSEIAKIAKDITVRLEGAGGQGSGVIVKKEGDRYTILTSWHVVKDNRPNEELVLSLIHI